MVLSTQWKPKVGVHEVMEGNSRKAYASHNMGSKYDVDIAVHPIYVKHGTQKGSR